MLKAARISRFMHDTHIFDPIRNGCVMARPDIDIIIYLIVEINRALIN